MIFKLSILLFLVGCNHSITEQGLVVATEVCEKHHGIAQINLNDGIDLIVCKDGFNVYSELYLGASAGLK
jgi:hypothetical protein